MGGESDLKIVHVTESTRSILMPEDRLTSLVRLFKIIQDQLAGDIVCSVNTQTQSVLFSINRPHCCCDLNF